MFFWWSKRVLGLKMAENGRKMTKKPFLTKKNFGHFWTILDLFGTKNRFFHPKNLFLCKISILSKKNFGWKILIFCHFSHVSDILDWFQWKNVSLDKNTYPTWNKVQYCTSLNLEFYFSSLAKASLGKIKFSIQLSTI